jgi:hypothetical protein
MFCLFTQPDRSTWATSDLVLPALGWEIARRQLFVQWNLAPTTPVPPVIYTCRSVGPDAKSNSLSLTAQVPMYVCVPNVLGFGWQQSSHASMFSGDRTDFTLPPCFLAKAEGVVRNLFTQLVMAWRSGILPCLPILKCRLNSRCVTTTESPFLRNVSIVNVRCTANQCSVFTATASLVQCFCVHRVIPTLRPQEYYANQYGRWTMGHSV